MSGEISVEPSSGEPPSGGYPEARAAWAMRLPQAEVAALVWDGDLDDEPPPAWAPAVWKGSPIASSPDAGQRPALDAEPQAEPAADPTAGPQGHPRRLCFATGDLRIALEVARRPPRTGWGSVRPPQALAGAVVHVQGPAGDRGEVRLDASGTFALSAVAHGPLRLVAPREGAPTLATSWVLID